MSVPASLLFLWCRAGCSASAVASALTFFPPEPPCYRLHRGDDGEYELELEEFLEARKIDGTGVVCEVHIVSTRQRTKIPVVLYRSPEARYTVIYSHGNATDIGAMHDRYLGLAEDVGMNVLGYDYTGYGAATGHPSEKNVYGDIAAVYDFARQQLCGGSSDGRGLPGGGIAMTAAEAAANSLRACPGASSTAGTAAPGSSESGRLCGHGLILYGQSVGSGPSCYMAAKGAVAGLVLHSPILSGMRVLTESRLLACLDIFPNLDAIRRAHCPVTVFHGMQDEEVHWSHGQRLFEAVPAADRREPWWVVDRGHNDICEGSGRVAEYHRRMRAFVDSLPYPSSSPSPGGGKGNPPTERVVAPVGARECSATSDGASSPPRSVNV